MKPAEFWDADLTPYETNLWIMEVSKQGIVMAWNIAALNRMGKTDKFPSSPMTLIGEEHRLRQLSDQESIAKMKRYIASQEKRESK